MKFFHDINLHPRSYVKTIPVDHLQSKTAPTYDKSYDVTLFKQKQT